MSRAITTTVTVAVVRGPGIDDIVESLHHAYSINTTVEFTVATVSSPVMHTSFEAIITSVNYERPAAGMFFIKFNVTNQPGWLTGEGFYNARDQVGELEICSIPPA